MNWTYAGWVGMGKKQFVAAAYAVFCAGCSFSDSPLTTACEGRVKNILLAPTTYRRVELKEWSETLTPGQWLGKRGSAHWEEDKKRRSEMERDGVQPAEFFSRLSYDADNAFGVPIRASVLCSYLSESPSMRDVPFWTIKIDGKTYAEWLTSH